MPSFKGFFRAPDWRKDYRIVLIALLVVALDQFTKQLALRWLGPERERVIIEGFFRFVCWCNTGAAYSFLRGHNGWLAVVAIVAIIVLFHTKHHFHAETTLGLVAFGLIFGGILGNLADRLHYKYVVDFLRFYLDQRGGSEIGFPAFNVADSAICTGVGLIFLITWREEQKARAAAAAAPPAVEQKA